EGEQHANQRVGRPGDLWGLRWAQDHRAGRAAPSCLTALPHLDALAHCVLFGHINKGDVHTANTLEIRGGMGWVLAICVGCEQRGGLHYRTNDACYILRWTGRGD